MVAGKLLIGAVGDVGDVGALEWLGDRKRGRGSRGLRRRPWLLAAVWF